MDRSRGIDKGGKFMRKALDEEWRVWCGNNECPSHAVSIDGKHLCLLVYENCGKDIRSCKPEEVEEWCIDHDVSTHYQNDVAQVYNDDNPFANWLRKLGYTFTCPPSNDEDNWDNIAIVAT